LDSEVSAESDAVDLYEQTQTASYRAVFNKIVSEDLKKDISENRELITKTFSESVLNQRQILQKALNLYMAWMVQGLESMHSVHEQSKLGRAITAGIQSASSKGIDFIPVVGPALSSIGDFIQHLFEESPKQIMANQIESWDASLEDVEKESDKLTAVALILSQDIELSRARQSKLQKAIQSLKMLGSP
jgi:hypothetical protein